MRKVNGCRERKRAQGAGHARVDITGFAILEGHIAVVALCRDRAVEAHEPQRVQPRELASRPGKARILAALTVAFGV